MNTELLKKLSECAIACDNCADACLGEENVKAMIKCIRTDRDCAAICSLTAAYISGNSEYTEAALQLCKEVCTDCAKECAKHDHDHCQICASACRACAELCEEHLNAVAA
ncbi:four-helix bundle copper-binding protein [Fulvivirga sediminis]|uniref:Four-helix bundle copper-binding protein n=1 Tax=Fulvivirga sediminis TaxID=2803949 RepID=A0A937FAS5_9BACT|nr:four-helix bundle copper-binding protein [Fulvivirga sediminis]MBL3658162.1 four-helix bundle copper-binding protein [Fulvivirga sediminis]